MTKKRNKPTTSSIASFFTIGVILYKKIDLAQKQLFEDLVFYIAKGYRPLNFA
jgi:hypothetical protein